MNQNNKCGWNWASFFLGPLWYISKGMSTKGVCLLILSIVTFFCAVPFLMIYCGSKGNSDWYEYQLKIKSEINMDRLK